MDEKEYIAKLQDQINQIIGTKSTLKRRKKNIEDAQREMFLTTIPLLAHIVNRGPMMSADYGIDMSNYDEPFLQIIDSLIFMHFGKDAGEVVMFYIYERVNPDGTINSLYDENDNPIPLERIEDLWELIKRLKK
jgi:hypothetical protein